MFVSLKKCKVASIVSLLLSTGALLAVYQSQKFFENIEMQYFSLLQQQTARFASRQSDQIKANFLDDHQNLFDRLARQTSIEQTRTAILEVLEKTAQSGDLFEVHYEFLQPQQLLEIEPEVQVLYDSVMLKGVASHMVTFNRAMEGINVGVPYFFELHHCDIKRVPDQAANLAFSCVLRWYLLA